MKTKTTLKTLFLSIVCALLCTYANNTYAQCDGDITLTSQEEIDNFPINYGCLEIGGDLIIEEAQEGGITNLDGLNNLISIGGDLNIGGYLQIGGYDALANLEGLQNLSSIGGDLRIFRNDALINLEGLQNLSSIGGGLLIVENAVLTNVDVIVNISSIGGDLSIIDNDALTSLSGLENISSIDGGLDIIGNDVLTSLSSLENISSIGGGLNIGENDVLTSLAGLENISLVAGDLKITENGVLTDLSGLANVSSIYGSLRISGNTILTDLSGLANVSLIGEHIKIIGNDSLTSLSGLENISSVGSVWLHGVSIIDNGALTSLSGLENLSSIVGALLISNNDALTSLSGLENLTSIGEFLSINNNDALSNLFDLENLSSIGGGLSISNNDVLTSLSGLENISSIGNDSGLNNSLIISYNDALTNVDGLQNISSVKDFIRIHNNFNLNNIDGLQNISSIGEELEIYNNPLLNSCCSVIGMLDGLGGDVLIYDNLPNCNSVEEILFYCSNNVIQSQAFFDQNENGLFDETEQIMFESFSLEPSAVYSFPNAEGVEYFLLDEFGIYQLSINNLHPLWTINGEDTIQIEFLDSLFTDTIHSFPLSPVADFVIQNIDITSSITRCNEQTNYWLSYTNEGTTINSGYVELIPDELTNFVSANPPADSIAGDTLYWFYEDLYPTHTNQIHLIYEMPGVTEFGEEIIGEEITFEAAVQVETEAGGKIGRKTISSELVCAYDPNDKLVTPYGYGAENYTLFGDTLEYTVRFQNTGNDTAFNVTIKDELSEFLDLKTFRPIASSHDVRTEIDLNTRIATFTFNDIYLPDSFVNEVASHGFVKYRILGNEGLDENTKIENTASIFFDSNPAIVTNTVSNAMVSVLPALPIISASPNELNFDEVVLQNSAYPGYQTQTLVINNTGDLPLEINSFDFENAIFNSGEIQTATIEGQNALEVPIYFAPDEIGTYESELTLQSNAGNLSIALNGTAVLNTGISNIEQSKIKVFPNPNEGLFYLDARDEKILSYQIQNILGEVIATENAVTDFNLIDMKKQSKGIYFLNIETEDGIFVQKLIVQ